MGYSTFHPPCHSPHEDTSDALSPHIILWCWRCHYHLNEILYISDKYRYSSGISISASPQHHTTPPADVPRRQLPCPRAAVESLSLQRSHIACDWYYLFSHLPLPSSVQDQKPQPQPQEPHQYFSEPHPLRILICPVLSPEKHAPVTPPSIQCVIFSPGLHQSPPLCASVAKRPTNRTTPYTAFLLTQHRIINLLLVVRYVEESSLSP